MKKVLKTLSCILVTSFALVGACACNNSVSDMRSRERGLRERQRQQEQQQRLLEQEEKTLQEEIDPDFSVDPRCPDCPEIPEDPDDENRTEDEEEPEKPIPPEHGQIHPRRGRHGKPKPAPYPLPHD